MKIYSCPKEVLFGEPDYANFDIDKERAREETHSSDLKAWLRNAGYDGPNTGRIHSMPVADGHASYMFADRGPDSALIHLPYGDAYQARDVQFVPKTEIIKRMDAAERLSEIFRTAAAERKDDDSPTP